MDSIQNTPSNMMRRKLAFSEESTSSAATSFLEDALASMKLGANLDLNEASREALSRLLSTKTAVSTTSSFAEEQQDAVSSKPVARQIGRGSCGVVYELPGTSDIYKFSIDPDGKALWNDMQQHRAVQRAFEEMSDKMDLDVHLPKARCFVKTGDAKWWEMYEQYFPDESNMKHAVLCAERILPLPKIIRESIIHLYIPEAQQERVRADRASRDCLVRIYLGKRKSSSDSPVKFVNMRNHIFTLDKIEDLNLDARDFAVDMADALAIMHWKAGNDANDVEFVLGSKPLQANWRVVPGSTASEEQTSTWEQESDIPNFRKRTIHLWLLDFNRCAKMPKNSKGIEQAVDRFFRNDPYYPRPLQQRSKDQELWKVFCDRYLQTSATCLGDAATKAEMQLPKDFIGGVVERMQAKMAKKA